MRLDVVVPVADDLELEPTDPWLLGEVEAAIAIQAATWTQPVYLGETDESPEMDGSKWSVPGCRLLRFTTDAQPR